MALLYAMGIDIGYPAENCIGYGNVLCCTYWMARNAYNLEDNGCSLTI
jgi:hypothetical protein